MDSLVSIITPTYNSREYISETIYSVLSQTYKNWEMIIVDDKSMDDTCEIVHNFVLKDSRIKLFQLSANSGPAVARNEAIKNSNGKYIAFLDSDDIWLPQKLEKQVAFMKKHDCEFSCTNYEIFSNSKNKIVKSVFRYSYKDILKSNCIGCLTAMYDSEKIGKVYMPILKRRQDYALWLKILKLIKYGYGLDEVLAKRRVLPKSVSSNKIKLLKYHYIIFRKFEKLSFFKTFYYLMWSVLSKFLYRF